MSYPECLLTGTVGRGVVFRNAARREHAWRCWSQMQLFVAWVVLRDAQAGLEYRAELARDPQFILAAAEKLLRSSGACALDGIASNGQVGLRWYPVDTAPTDSTASVRYSWAPTLPEAYAKLLAARKERADG